MTRKIVVDKDDFITNYANNRVTTTMSEVGFNVSWCYIIVHYHFILFLELFLDCVFLTEGDLNHLPPCFVTEQLVSLPPGCPNMLLELMGIYPLMTTEIMAIDKFVPAMNWQLVRGVSLPSPYDNWGWVR